MVEVASDEPRERGRQYGRLSRDLIARSIAYYAELFRREFGARWSEIAVRSLAWLSAIESYDADLAEEIRGLAEGSGRELGEIVALNARGEMVYGNYVAPLADGCTSFTLLPEASSDGHLYCGQNWDWRVGTADTWVALRIEQPPKPTIVMVVEAGQIGRHGANSAGMALLSNGLSGFCTREPGVPQPFIRRRALDSTSFSGALEVVLGSRQQIAANIMLAHRDGFALDVETTPDGHGWLYPHEGILVHGNHYEVFTWAHDGSAYRPLGADSIYRVFQVRQALSGHLSGQGREDSSLDRIATGLADHFGYPSAVCCHPEPGVDPLEQWQTLSSSIIDLTTGEWRLAAGPPCSNDYELLPWNLYG